MVRHTGENLVNEERVAIAMMLSFQAAGINGTELDTPEADCFAGESNAAFGQEILDIPVTQIEAIVEPDGITDDVGWESVTFVCIHRLMLPVMATLLGSTLARLAARMGMGLVHYVSTLRLTSQYQSTLYFR